MEPPGGSITRACTSLISSIAETSSVLSSFMRNYRNAHRDLDDISRELTSIKNTLNLLRVDIAAPNDDAIPETLRIQITGTIDNVRRDVQRLDELLRGHNTGRRDQAAGWANTGRPEAARLRWSLVGHGGSLNSFLERLAPDLQSRPVPTATTTPIWRDAAQNLDPLHTILPSRESRIPASNLILNRFIDNMDPAETILEMPNGSDGRNDAISESPISSRNSYCPSQNQEPVPDTSNLPQPHIQRRTFSIFRRNRNPYPMDLRGHDGWVLDVAFSPDGRLIASASRDSTIRLWNPATGVGQGAIEGHSSCVRAVAFSPDGRLLASASLDHTVGLWGVTAAGWSGRGMLEGHTDSVQAVAFSPDGNLVASSSNDRTVRLWDLATRRNRARLDGHNDSVWAVTFSPDGRFVASASLDGIVKLWDPATRYNVRTFRGHGDSAVRAVAFSPDSRLVASASHDKTIKLWDPETGQIRRTCKGHSSWVQAVAFSCDGRLLASASSDNTVRLWDVATGRRRASLLGHKDSVQAVAFSPDGRLLASSSNDRIVRVWDLAMEM